MRVRSSQSIRGTVASAWTCSAVMVMCTFRRARSIDWNLAPGRAPQAGVRSWCGAARLPHRSGQAAPRSGWGDQPLPDRPPL
nr:hypothetical protein GCM10010200_059670 [Actinomadura rugatobispora]